MYQHALGVRTQFVAVAPRCGCPIAAQEASTEVPNADIARYVMAGGERSILLDWRRREIRVIPVSHEQYETDYYPRMLAGCPHRQRGGAT